MKPWTTQYLKHLGLKPECPSEEFLKSLYQRHLACIPYEVTSKFVYSQSENFIPTVECFVHNLVHRGFGGNCYILNLNFMRLLEALGFNGHLVKVNPGHVGIVVSLSDHEYYVDVGYGAPLNQLVPVGQRDWGTEAFGEEIRFTHVSGRVVYDRLNNGQVFVSKDIELKPATESEFVEDINKSFLDINENRFMRRISMALVTGSAYCWVRNNRIVTRSATREDVIDFDGTKDWVSYVTKQFGLNEQDLEFTLSFLKDRDVDLGFKF